MTEDRNGRTHEPNLRELTAEIDGLRNLTNTRFTYVEKVQDERHQLYKERAESQKVAVDDALAAQKEQTTASFQASEKAIVKAEESQKVYNQGHNDLSRKMEAQYSTMVPQAEAKLKWDSIDKAIEELRKENAAAKTEAREQVNSLRIEFTRDHSGGLGKDEAQRSYQQQKNTSIGLWVAILMGAAAIVAEILRH
jgi:hypothetical protein